MEQNTDGRLVPTVVGTQSPILITTITLKRLAQKGYVSMLDYYLAFAPLPIASGLMNRCIRDPYVQWCTHMCLFFRGIRDIAFAKLRGAPRLLTQARPSTRLCVRANLSIMRFQLNL